MTEATAKQPDQQANIASSLQPLRPLSVHLAHSQSCWGSAVSGLLAALEGGEGSPLIHPSLRGEWSQLLAALGSVEKAALLREIGDQSRANLERLLAGIDRYLKHPYRREATASTCVAVYGTTRLLDFGRDEGQPILLVPSLINPATILDLMPGRSLIAFLRARGYRPFLLDWQAPGAEEAGMGLEGYIKRRVIPALEHIKEACGQSALLFGYCMGGTLSIAAAAVRPDLVAGLSLLASPWDFKKDGGPAGQDRLPFLGLDQESPEKTDANQGADDPASPAGAALIPADAVQLLFTTLDPMLNDRKFRAFAAQDAESEAATFFVAVEAWANGCAPLSRHVARDVMKHWYRDNAPAEGAWMIGDNVIDIEAIPCPIFLAVPRYDRLVPSACALALADGASDCVRSRLTLIEPAAGHVGVLVGSAARAGLWQPLADWLDSVSPI